MMRLRCHRLREREWAAEVATREEKYEMGLWIRCKCDQLVHKNLFCGTGISVLATEAFLDEHRDKTSADDLISDLVRRSDLLLTCGNCGRKILVKETRDVFGVRFFKPEQDE
ncbi:hypothetical protein CR47_0206885 [Ralstonia solanacearum]|nr:hypothetical protein CCY86_13140 [Ralstonia solanacearum]ATJ87115.1 hypothetical protein CDC59_13065 [Ralstonia solanacearum]KEI30873.1 hypothetical protein CQ06_03240 [Ralstonia solanacearum]KFX79318.1 hypothetical protein KR98_08940 [Ralstonia solanacearum]KFX81450.1 hypothetical protein KR99_23115 [Ralstonia solanacearum]